MLLATAVVSALSSRYILPRIIGFIANNDKTVKNYRSKQVYNCGGLFLSFNLVIVCSFILCVNFFLFKTETDISILVLIIGTFSASLTGYIDDNSNDKVKGLSGHIKSLRNNILTSGIIKAFTGVLTSLIICFVCRYSGYNFLINFLIIPLSQNFINLLDLRPARAIKAYSAFSIMLLPFMFNNNIYLYALVSIAISLLFYMPHELNETLILGDTGSNLLGIILGIIIASINNLLPRIVLLIFFIIVQIYAERKSINLLIERHYVLKLIDMVGRRIYIDDKDKEGNSKRNNQ